MLIFAAVHNHCVVGVYAVRDFFIERGNYINVLFKRLSLFIARDNAPAALCKFGIVGLCVLCRYLAIVADIEPPKTVHNIVVRLPVVCGCRCGYSACL